MNNTNPSDNQNAFYQSLFGSTAFPIQLDWETYLRVSPPYAVCGFREVEVVERHTRNGYDWDMHGRLYVPEKQVIAGNAFVLIHGGGVNELDFQATPDGRPGLARALAAQGFPVLTPSYPGLWPPGGTWPERIEDRKPHYLLDRKLPDEEIADRLHKATFPVYMEGIAHLVDKHLPNHKLFVLGHSTGGPMAACLYQYLRSASVRGIVGWGSGGFDGWIKQWREAMRAGGFSVDEDRRKSSIGGVIYRSVAEYRNSAGYEDLPELTPWGRMEDRFRLVGDRTPSFNPDLQVSSHWAKMDRLAEYQCITGLPSEEFFSQLDEPDAEFLRGISVLLLVGEADKGHWQSGGPLPEQRQDGFIFKRYAETAKKSRLMVIPKYTHMGHWALHSEKLAYLWLWAVRCGYFD